MSSYKISEVKRPAKVPAGEALQIASGDLRQSANRVCWPAQDAVEKKPVEVFRSEGVTLRRATFI
jgi:hypothetical protein